jgi:hypothetical protein
MVRRLWLEEIWLCPNVKGAHHLRYSEVVGVTSRIDLAIVIAGRWYCEIRRNNQL